MKKAELIEVLKLYKKGNFYIHQVLTAIDAYSTALIAANTNVSGSLPLDDTLTESEYKESDAAFYENYGQRQ